MFIWYYWVVFAATVLCSGIYLLIWRRNYSVQFTVVYILVPIVSLGYVLLAASRNLREAIVANKIVYLGGCFLLPAAFFATLSLCGIRLKRWCIMLLMACSVFIYAGVLSIGHTWVFYRDVQYSVEYGTAVLKKEYGPIHTLFYVMEILYILAGVFILIYAWRKKKKEVSMKNLLLLVLSQVITLFSFFFGRAVTRQIEWVPLSYVAVQIIFLVIIDRICLYDIGNAVSDLTLEKGETGVVLLDFDLNFLNCNEAAVRMLPELSVLSIDQPLARGGAALNEVEKWVRQFEMRPDREGCLYERDGVILRAVVNYLTDGRKKRGYQISLTDETKNREYIRLMQDFNQKLQEEEETRASRTDELFELALTRLSDIVEDRGSGYVSHSERIKEVTTLLIREIQDDPGYPINAEFCEDLIKASVLYDIGKIAVSDALLYKPGKFTQAEYEKMQIHAEEGEKIIAKLLDGIRDDAFLMIARNAALYHHERWDGTGYPRGIRGIQIPLEARILAIADVYDALVTNRCYKEKMSFREASRTVNSLMGTWFDKNLGIYFEKALEKIEMYYSLKAED